MSCVRVTGKNKLNGDIKIQGCKNAVLPIIAASLLNGGLNVIHNCPHLADVYASVKILKELGAVVSFEGNTLVIDSSGINCKMVEPELMGALRSSVVFLGSMLSRCSKACVSMPGGCDIGMRPIDIHLSSFEKMGVEVECTGEGIKCEVNNLHSEKIVLPFPSVGATENIMLLAVKGRGVTTIHNAAREPEIVDLQNFLNSMGARVFGAGTGVITIYAVKKLHDSEYTVMSDRIEAATFACAAVATGGRLFLNGIRANHMRAVINVLKKCGATVVEYPDCIDIISQSSPICPDYVSTRPYPGFPTDAQSLIMSVMSCSKGEGTVVENIFENRFGHASELKKMGADIVINGRSAYVRGNALTGALVSSRDLRSGASLTVAALAADGESIIQKAEFIDRGYDSFEKKLESVGAKIERIE